MANLMRNDLTIEGPNVQRVLDAIGFEQPSTLVGLPDVVLIDLYRLGHEFGCRWPMPYFGADLPGDIFELSEHKVAFKFYTRDGHAQQVVWGISRKYPEYKIRYECSDPMNGYRGGEVLQAGKQLLWCDYHSCGKCYIPETAPTFASDLPPLAEDLPRCQQEACDEVFPRTTQEQLDAWRTEMRQREEKEAIEEDWFEKL